MQLPIEKNIANESQMRLFAAEIWDKIFSKTPSFTLFLHGGLGVGKTFLVREILKNAGICDLVPSPTYLFCQQFEKNNFRLAHFDFYRLENSKDFWARGFGEIAENPEISSAVEWSENLGVAEKSAFSGQIFHLRLQHGVGVGMRKIKLLAPEK